MRISSPLFSHLQSSVSKILLGRVSAFLTIWIFVCSSYSASAQTFSLPATSSTGQYTITWSGATTYGVIDELLADGTFVSSPAGGTASGSVTITRPTGTYYYRLRTCVAGQGSPVCTYSATKSVTVTIPVPTVTAYFNPSTVAPGGSTVLTWTSTNAEYCTSAGYPGVSATSGTLTYTVPADYSQPTLVVVITCLSPAPRTARSAGANLTIIGGATVTYSYDELGRIKEAKHAGNDTVTYEYDTADNRTKKVVTKH